MKVVLAKNDKLLTYMLPNKVTGNIWLSEIDENGIEKNIINLEANSDGEWKIVSNSDYYIVENSKRVPFVVAKENSYYEITYAYSYDKVYLFMPSTYEKMHFYSCSTELPMGITIGSDSNCTISYNFNAIQSNAITIKQEGPNIIITNNDNQTNIFINGLKVNSGTKIEIGDVIFILGLELLLLKKDGNYVLGISNNYNNVQTFMKSVEMQQDLSQNRIDEPQEEKDMELYSKEDYFYRKPRFIYSINSISIRVDNPPGGGDKNEMPAILTIGPMLTMSMTSVMTFYTTMNNVNNGNQTMNNAIPSLVMSGAMMLSFLMWPLLTNRFQKRLEKKKEKERKKKYSAYIDSIKKQALFERACFLSYCSVSRSATRISIALRYSTFVTVTVHCPIWKASPSSGTLPSSCITHPLTVDTSYSSLISNNSSILSKLALHEIKKEPSLCCLKSSCSSSCSSQISPTNSSKISSNVAIPTVPPNSSSTIAICVLLCCKMRSNFEILVPSVTTIGGFTISEIVLLPFNT